MTANRRGMGLIACGLVAVSTLTGCTSGLSVDKNGNTIATNADGTTRTVVTAGQTVPSIEALNAEDIIIAAVQHGSSGELDKKQLEANEAMIREFADSDPNPVEGVEMALEFMELSQGIPDWYESGQNASTETRRRASAIINDPYVLNMMTDELRTDVEEDREGVALPSVFANGSVGTEDGKRWNVLRGVPSSVYTLPTLSAPTLDTGDPTPAFQMSGSRTIEWETADELVLQPTSYTLTVEHTDSGWKVSDMEYQMQDPSVAGPDYTPADPAPVHNVVFMDHPQLMEFDAERQQDKTVNEVFDTLEHDVPAGVQLGLDALAQRAEAKELRSLVEGEMLLVEPFGAINLIETDPVSTKYHLSLVKAQENDGEKELVVTGLVEEQWSTENGMYDQVLRWEVILVPQGSGWSVKDFALDAELATAQSLFE